MAITTSQAGEAGQMRTPRALLLTLYQSALQAVEGRRCVANALRQGEPAFDHKDLALVAVGKAALSMAEGAVEVLGERIQAGLVITKAGYGPARIAHAEHIEIIEGAHPVPDARSLAAGRRLVDFLKALPADVPLLFLTSGGTSSLVEVLPETMNLTDLQQLNDSLLASGLAIAEMNRRRKQASLIKGGRLAGYLNERPVLNLLLSDVPDNALNVIGSGLLVPDERDEFFIDPACLESIQYKIIADNQQACLAAKAAAEARGLPVRYYDTPLQGEVTQVAHDIMARLTKAKPGIHIWGGEPTVVLPEQPGRGGRNQQLALLLAVAIQQRPELHILVAATDGSDGPTEEAGALVDSETVRRGEQEGMSAQASLQRADAGRFLEASGDLISTGPTGTNVMDIVIAHKMAYSDQV